MPKNSQSFSARLKQLRVTRGLSQTELGAQVEVHYTHIGKYERGESSPSLETLQLLAKALGVTTDYLINGSHEDAAVANLEDRELLEMFTEVENFSSEDKQHIKAVLDAFIKKKKLQQLVG